MRDTLNNAATRLAAGLVDETFAVADFQQYLYYFLSVWVQRQYSGPAGKVDNCQIGVFLAYGSRRGQTFLNG